MSDRKKKSGESVSTYTPNRRIKPYLNQTLREAGNQYEQYGNTPHYYTAQGYAPETEQGWRLAGGLANDPRHMNAAIGQNTATASGAYLDPTGDPRFQRGLDMIGNQAATVMGGARRIGSGAHGQVVGEAGGSLLAGIYNQERDRMGRASALAPGLERGRYIGSDALRNVGADREARGMAAYEMDEAGGRQAEALARLEGVTNRSPYNEAGTRSNTQYTWTNPAMQWGGLGLQAAGMLAAPFTGGASLAAIPAGQSISSGGGGLTTSGGDSSAFPGGWEQFYGLMGTP
jgi:hypothetical protein